MLTGADEISVGKTLCKDYLFLLHIIFFSEHVLAFEYVLVLLVKLSLTTRVWGTENDKTCTKILAQYLKTLF